MLEDGPGWQALAPWTLPARRAASTGGDCLAVAAIGRSWREVPGDKGDQEQADDSRGEPADQPGYVRAAERLDQRAGVVRLGHERPLGGQADGVGQQAAPGEPVSGISAASRPGTVSGRVMKPSASGGTRAARTGHAPPGTWLPVGPAGGAWPSAGVNP